MEYPVRKYPIVGVCGLDCGLCPRHYTEGPSRCPGCCGAGFSEKHPSCRFATCCVMERGLETCALCPDWAGCEKIARTLDTTVDCFISYRPVRGNFAFIQRHGIEAFARLETEKMEFLRYLLDNYNDGRARMFYCAAAQLLPLDRFKEAVKSAEARIPKDTDIKEKTRIVRAEISKLAESLNADLRLRKKP